ncbi:hypothetical protein NXW05_15760 [Phocaeicola vulgatus]|nr:hypothetical protein [Phocaeicola vulgatus]
MPPRWNKTPATEYPSSSSCPEACQRTTFFDFCLQGMLSSAESASGQAVCMKLAYDICLEEPELTGELKAYLENMEPEYYTVAVQCVRNNILKKIR